MGKTKRYLALDFGHGTSGALVGTFSGDTLTMEPLHWFNIESTSMLSTTYWDFPAVMLHAKRGLSAFARAYGDTLAGVGCNSWNVDFGLLDKTGHLLANPVHHLDPRTEGALDKLRQIFPDRSLYQRTGIRTGREGTLVQLFSMAQANSPLLDKAVTLLLIADLASYFLTGIPVQEYTLASTTGMYDMESRDWSRDIILGAKIPPVMMPEVVAPGTVIGPLLDSVALECGLGQIPVIAPASHGVACAVAATPAAPGEKWIAVSGGYRNQVTVELSEPIINDAAFAADFSNLGGVDGSIRLQKEVPGLGMLEECARVWSRSDNQPVTLADVLRMAEEAGPQKQVLNLENFPGGINDDVPAILTNMLAESGQEPAAGRGELAGIYLNSMVLAHAEAIRQATELTGRKYNVIHFGGRGADFPLFGQWLADATDMRVRAGSAEAKAVGNVLMQMLALGDIGSLDDGRELAARSLPTRDYQPRNAARWDDLFAALYKN